jgi:glycosyltransferase involved in cell wall biosynthesis
MMLSFVIPAFQASETIGATLRSVFFPFESSSMSFDIEALIVDDGSRDHGVLAGIVQQFPKARLFRHPVNRGMCASRNTGILESHGDLVVILDADDELVREWPTVLDEILKQWPDELNVCFSACRTPDGYITVNEPSFSGPITFEDLLNECHSGEYLPMFRGAYIRNRKYVDLGLRKSCGILSYLLFAQDAPIWATSKVMRIYKEREQGSITSNWTTAEKARETVRCYQVLFDRFGDCYKKLAPRTYRTKLLRYAVYHRLAGEKGAWQAWLKGAHWTCIRETLGVFSVLLVGQECAAWIVKHAKRKGFIRQYG